MGVSRRDLIVASAYVAGAAAGSNIVRSTPATAQEVPKVLEGDIPPEILALLDPGDAEFPMTASLHEIIEFGSTKYYVIAQSQADQKLGEPIVIKKPVSGDAVILEDFVGLPRIPAPAGSFPQETDIVLEFFALPNREAEPNRLPPNVPLPAEATVKQDRKVFATADQNVGLSSRSAPGTNKGRLACAWAVNRIVDRALNRPILDGPAGLATANLVKVLRAKHVRVRNPVPGAIVISPTVYHPKANIGHVGIVGENNSIYSNSSNDAEWQKNFTVDSWEKYYVGRKRLSMEFYRLDDVYFPQQA